MQELPTIYSNQEETDTRVVLYLRHAVSLGYKKAVVRTPDMDIFVILLYHAHSINLTVYLDTGSGKNRQMINLSELATSLGEDYCATLLGLYVFTGEDCTSALKGKVKVGPLKKLEKNPRFHKAFKQLGDEWNVKSDVLKQMELFTCLIYGQPRETSIDSTRVKLLHKMVGEDKTLSSKSKVDLSRLPPCHSALKAHPQRVNHRVALYKRANQQIIEHIDCLLTIPGSKILFGGKKLLNNTIPPIYGSFQPTALEIPIDKILGDNFKKITKEVFGPFQIIVVYEDKNMQIVKKTLENISQNLTAAVVSNDVLFQQEILASTVNGTTYSGMKARTTGAPQNHWFGPSGDPRSAGIGTPEAIISTWSSHREIIKDVGPL